LRVDAGDRPQSFNRLQRGENLLSIAEAISAVTAAEDLTRIKFSSRYFTDDRQISQVMRLFEPDIIWSGILVLYLLCLQRVAMTVRAI
jgi:hypothetical protein